MKRTKYFVMAMIMCLSFVLSTSAVAVSTEVEMAYAKLSDDLLSAFSGMGSNETLDVIVWLEDNSTDEYNNIVANIPVPSFVTEETEETETYSLQTLSTEPELSEEERAARMEEMQNYIMQKRQIAQAVYLEDNTVIANELSEYGTVEYISRYSPLVICNLTQDEAVDVAMNSSVRTLTNGEIEGENCMEISRETLGISNVQDMGYTAQGIIIGMIEDGVPDKNLSCFSNIKDKFSTNGPINEHGSFVAAIMVHPLYGIAKEFEKLYCESSMNLAGMIQGVDNLLDKGVNVINISWGYENLGENSYIIEYDEYSLWLDHIAYNHSVHCVVASGNGGDSGRIDAVIGTGMSNNAITVGAIFDQDTEYLLDDVLTTFSAYNSTFTEEVNKPDICAPGQNISIPGTSFSGHGTSFATPHVSGIVAVLCSRKPELLIAQDQMKAIITASAIKAFRNYNTSDSYFRQYGAGIVHMGNAVSLINAGTFQGGSITNSEDRDYISLGTIQKGTTITVSLSFLKRARFAISDHGNLDNIIQSELPDLDVLIAPKIAMPIPYTKSTYEEDAESTSPRFGHVHRSISSNNNVEKITFTAGVTDEFIITINKETSYDSYEILYGIAWQIHNSNLT